MKSFGEYFSIWNKLSVAQQQLLFGNTIMRSIPKGTIVSRGMQDCTGLMLMKAGQLRVYSLSADGRELTLYRLFERDICLFSASCMLRSMQFDLTIEAEKDSEFWMIPTEIYKRLMEDSTVVANYTNEIMASRFSDVMWLIDQIMWKSFDKRLAAFLVEESGIENSLILKTTHEAIGNHLGNPREVVTRMLRYFQSEGLIKLSRGTIDISDFKGLQHIAGQ